MMNLRSKTRPVKLGNLQVGGQNKVVIQSMCNIKTERINEVAAQINRCAALGAETMRLSVMDEKDALAIKEIKKLVAIPLIADIHFDYRLALAAIEAGVDGVRINPGNIGKEENVEKVVEAAKKHHVPIRIGINSGSVDKTINDGTHPLSAADLVASAKKHVDILEKYEFYDIALSLKGTDVLLTIEANRLASSTFPYPLHLGITEAGTKEIGIIRSAAGLAPMLLEGIGDTIRISLTAEPEEEIIAAKRLLHDLELYPNYPTLISCPTCGRTEVNVEKLASEVLNHLETINKPISVAVMGCVVNGPGEAKQADIGIAGGKNRWVIFSKGEVIRTVLEEDALAALIEEIDKI